MFNLYKNGRGKHIVEVDKRLNNTFFFFLVNYLRYPEYIEYNPIIKAYTIALDKDYFAESDINRLIEVYIPENNSKPDSIRVITETNKTLEIDFARKVKILNTDKFFDFPEYSLDSIKEKESIKLPEPISEDERLGINYSSFYKRFNIISISYLILLFVSLHLVDSIKYNNYFVFLLMIPYGWLFFDHDYLFKIKGYLRMLLFSSVLVAVGFYIAYYNLMKSSTLAFSFLCVPLFFLILQKILSLVYMKIFKKRPDIYNNSFVEAVFYKVPLLILPVIISVFLIKLIEFNLIK